MLIERAAVYNAIHYFFTGWSSFPDTTNMMNNNPANASQKTGEVKNKIVQFMTVDKKFSEIARPY